MPKGRPGRPGKLTPALQDKIVSAIRAGNYAEVAAAYAGIGKTTYYMWMQKGESGDSKYLEFRNAIRTAEAEAEVYAETILRKAMPDDWKAAAWYLERKFQDRWGRKESIDQRSSVTVDIKDMRESLASKLAGLATGTGAGRVAGEPQ